jgi:pyruvate kinase
VWGAENKANVVAISYIRNKENVDMIKAFLKDIR